MQIDVRFSEVEKSEALEAHVSQAIEQALRHVGDRFHRVDVHLHDENEAKGGDDKRCVIEARPNGANPVVVETRGTDLYQTAAAAAKKLERAARHFVDRHRSH